MPASPPSLNDAPSPVQTDPPSLRRDLGRLWGHLGRRRRRQLQILAVLMLASSLTEMLSLGAVVPFLAVLAEPERLWRTGKAQWISQLMGWQQPSDLVVPLCLAFVGTALLAGVVRLVALRGSIGLANAIGSDLSIAVYRHLLYRPYALQLRSNSSEAISTIANEVTAVVGILNGLLQFTTACLVSLGLATVLLWLNPGVTLAVGIVVVGGYGLVIALNRRRVQQLGSQIVVDHRALIRSLQEGMSAIRDVILSSSQPTHLSIYEQVDRRLRRQIGQGYFLTIAPRYGMEAVGLMAIGATALVLRLRGGGFLGVLPLLGALALGAQRLLPTLQLIYGSWNSLRVNQPALQSLLNHLELTIDPVNLRPLPAALPLQGQVRLENVSFRYSEKHPWVLRRINLSINAGDNIGIIGETGSGKSTLVDLLMGLLEPCEGRLLVNGQPIVGDLLRSWRASIAHVPQNIFLVDGSIAANIAFGVPADQINWPRLQQAAERACIAGFVNSLVKGYHTGVGERGMQLSGGQRQRIGIARALYRNAEVLVFDEATSALDSDTEAAVIEAITSLSPQLTIVMIAHRLSSLRTCNRCIRIHRGELTQATAAISRKP